jgi:hypothetical protein
MTIRNIRATGRTSFLIDQELERAVGFILAICDLRERLILLGEEFFYFAEAIEDDERENDPRDGKQEGEQADDEHQEAAENACCCIGISRRDHAFEIESKPMLSLQDRFWSAEISKTREAYEIKSTANS